MQDLPIWQKAAIGAVGGLALAMLKLIDARFYLDSSATVEAHAAYLTYFCYMLLGSVAAVFLADHELPSQKVRRSAFVLGLLAPSVLLAIANQPFKAAQGTQTSAAIPSLSWLPISSAVAQVGSITAKEPLSPQVEVLKRSSLEPSFGNAFSAALGRTNLRESYALVVGSTEDKSKALETAGRIRTLFLAGSGSSEALTSKVVQIDGEQKYFVLVGGISSSSKATQIKGDATLAALKAVGAPSPASSLTSEERRSLAAMLANAPVVPARSLSAAVQ